MKTLISLLATVAFTLTANATSWMKGAEVYAWKDNNGHAYYALLPGTNRQKNFDEIFNARGTQQELLHKLKRLPADTYIVLSDTKYQTPSKIELRRLKGKIAALGLTVH